MVDNSIIIIYDRGQGVKKEMIDRKKKVKINKEKIRGLADNAMLKYRIELFDEWDFEKNDKLGLDVKEDYVKEVSE